MKKNRNKNFGGSGQPFSRQTWAKKLAYCKENGVKFQFENLEEVDDYLSSTKLLCLECGQEFGGLANHIIFTHKYMSGKDYKIKYGIPITIGLVGAATRGKQSESRKILWKENTDYAEKGRKNIAKIAGFKDNTLPKYKREKRFRKKSDPKIIENMREIIAKKRRDSSEPKYIAAIKKSIKEGVWLHQACKDFGITGNALFAFVHLERTDKHIKEMYAKAVLIPKNELGVTGIRKTVYGSFQARTQISGKNICKNFPSLEEAQKWRDSIISLKPEIADVIRDDRADKKFSQKGVNYHLNDTMR